MVRILTYNILAPHLASHRRFPHVENAKHLSWEYRRALLLKQILSYDIVCLQEMSTSAYNQTFEPELNQRGFAGCFFPKTTKSSQNYYREMLHANNMSANDMYFHESNGPDEIGNAIFWRVNMFEHISVGYIALTDIWFKRRGKKDGIKYSQPQVAALALLKCKQTGIIFLVCNVHISPLFTVPEVQLAQVHYLLERLNEVLHSFRQNNVCDPDIPLFICGDFNSSPRSAVYQLLSQAWVLPSPAEFPGLYKSKSALRQFPVQLPASHNLGPLVSAHQHLYGREPLFTNSVPNFQECIDYIWFRPGTNGQLLLEQVQSPACVPNLFLPTAQHPSDHLPLSAQFSWKCQKEQQDKSCKASVAFKHSKNVCSVDPTTAC
jgi:CCR4-NOT transcription complex subunit 6